MYSACVKRVLGLPDWPWGQLIGSTIDDFAQILMVA